MSLKRKSTIVDIENAIQDINKLLKDYSDEQEKINDILYEKNPLYDKLQAEGDEIEVEYQKKNKMVEDYEENNGLKGIPITEKEKDGDWTKLAIAADDERDKLIMNGKIINQLYSELQKYESEFDTIDLLKKTLVETLMKLHTEKSNKKTHTQVQNRVRFGEQDIFGFIPNNPVNIQSRAHLDKYGNPVFFEDLQGTIATDPDTQRGEGMFYTSDKLNYNIEKAKRQDRIEKVREKLEEEQQRLEEEEQQERQRQQDKHTPQASTLALQQLRKKEREESEGETRQLKKQRIEGGSRVKELLKRTKNILKRVEKILSKKKGTRKIKGGMEESHRPPYISQPIRNIEVGKVFTVDGVEGEYKVTKLALIDHGSKIIINSEKVGSVQPIKLNLVYNFNTGEVTEGIDIPSPSTPYMGRNNREWINLRANEIAQFLGIDLSQARKDAIEEFIEKERPEISHPRRGGTRKHKKSKRKGTRKNKKIIK